MQKVQACALEGVEADASVCGAFAELGMAVTLHLSVLWAMCSGKKLEAWKVAAKDGEVLNKKQEPMDSPLQGPLQSKGGFVYALSKEGFWLCSMPLSGRDHITSDYISISRTRLIITGPFEIVGLPTIL